MEFSPEPLQTYTVFLDYFATGEGLTEAVLVVTARDSEAAKAAFLDAHGYHGSIREFFGWGLQVTKGVDRALLSRWLAPRFVDGIERQMRSNAQFKLHWHFNAG